MGRQQQERDERAKYAVQLGINLQRLRGARGLSQEQLAHAAGLSAYTYFKLEKGESQPGTPANPRLFTLLGLAEALEVSIEDMLPKP